MKTLNNNMSYYLQQESQICVIRKTMPQANNMSVRKKRVQIGFACLFVRRCPQKKRVQIDLYTYLYA